MHKGIKIYVLSENHAGPHFEAEHGLSYYIKTPEKNILFDTGSSDLFLRNASRLSLDIVHHTDVTVLSHGHWDHAGGLAHLSGGRLVSHPKSFCHRFRKGKPENIGATMSLAQIKKYFTPDLHTEPYEIAKNTWFLGEIPRNFEFENTITPYIFADGTQDPIPDDSALAIKHNDELILIAGCAHSGICNIHAYAKHVTGAKKTRLVMGGFHLKDAGERTQQTIEYFLQEQVNAVYPSHCTELPALCAFHSILSGKQITTGTILHL